MTTYPEQAGQPSPIFGERFSYPFDGKAVLRNISDAFAREFNEGAIAKLISAHGKDRAEDFRPLTVTSAYPTTKDNCPRIAIQLTTSRPQPSGLGLDYAEGVVEFPNDDGEVTEKARIIASEVVEDMLEVTICTLNERLRDDLFTWYRMYLLDAVRFALPQLRDYGFHDLRTVDAADGQVEYQGTQSQPGFQFYTAQIVVKVVYELTIFRDVDVLKTFFNWQNAWPAEPISTGSVGDVGTPGSPPDSVYQP